MGTIERVLSSIKRRERVGPKGFEVGTLTLSALRLLGTSKVGHPSWIAQVDGQPVKIYECHNQVHAQFIEEVTTQPVLRDHMPKCLHRQGAYLIVEWVRGEPLTWEKVRHDPDILRRVARLQASFHSTQISSVSSSFDYKAYLKNRLERYVGVLPLDRLTKDTYAALDHDFLVSSNYLSHPDLTARNIVVEKGTGSLKLIDNELLTQNNYYLIDLFNTYWSFGKRLRSQLVEPYLVHYMESGGDLSYLIDHERFFNLLWHLRIIGSLLQAGKVHTIQEAFEVAQQDVEGDAQVTHPIVQLVKEKLL